MPRGTRHPGAACGDGATSAQYINRLINKKDGIVNKVFVEMLVKLGYDIQITYVKKETNV